MRFGRDNVPSFAGISSLISTLWHSLADCYRILMSRK